VQQQNIFAAIGNARNSDPRPAFSRQCNLRIDWKRYTIKKLLAK
jgi:hypothetical protein